METPLGRSRGFDLRSLQDEMLAELERLKVILRGEDDKVRQIDVDGNIIRLPRKPKCHSTNEIIRRLQEL